MQPDWNYISKLLGAGGLSVAILKWVVPRIVDKTIKDTVKDLYDLTEDHNNRLGKNEITMLAHSKEISSLVSTVNLLQIQLAALPRIENSIDRISNNIDEMSKTVYFLKGKTDG